MVMVMVTAIRMTKYSGDNKDSNGAKIGDDD